jgi:hypothetical protein
MNGILSPQGKRDEALVLPIHGEVSAEPTEGPD